MVIAMRLPSGDTRGVPTYAPGLASSGSCLPVVSSHCTVALESPTRRRYTSVPVRDTSYCASIRNRVVRDVVKNRDGSPPCFHALEVERHGEHRRFFRVHEMATRQVTRRPDPSRECLARAIGDGDDVNGEVVLARSCRRPRGASLSHPAESADVYGTTRHWQAPALVFRRLPLGATAAHHLWTERPSR